MIDTKLYAGNPKQFWVESNTLCAGSDSSLLARLLREMGSTAFNHLTIEMRTVLERPGRVSKST